MATQCELILKHLKKGKKINPIQALNRYGCFRLGARIHDLKAEGHDIKSKIVENEEGTKHYAEYFMESSNE